MKFLVTALMLLAASAGAETKLTCWNVYSKKGASPMVRADFGQENELANININFDSAYFKDYKSYQKNANWEQMSELYQPGLDPWQPSLIETKRSPYIGNNEYRFPIGQYRSKSKHQNYSGTYDVRWILPTDLSAEFLKNYRIGNGALRSNSVMVIPPPAFGRQSGDNYLRLFCVSR